MRLALAPHRAGAFTCARASRSRIRSRASSSSSSSSNDASRLAKLTNLDDQTLAALGDEVLDARPLVKRMLLLRTLIRRGDVERMIACEPALVSRKITDEDLEYRARDALEAIELRVKWRNVAEFLVECEPGLLLGYGGQMRLDEIRDFAVEHEENLAAIAGDGEEWLSIPGQRWVSNFAISYY